jgi:hypothetical protein
VVSFGGGLAVVASVGTADKTAAVSGVERLPGVCADETWVESGTVGAAAEAVGVWAVGVWAVAVAEFSEASANAPTATPAF